MGTTSHRDDRYNKIYYKDFVRYYENNKPDYSSGAGIRSISPALELLPSITGGSSAPVVVLARLRWHKLSLK